MKKALLVLAANSPECLDVFVKYCSGDDYKFYVHLDLKKNLEEYQGSMSSDSLSRVNFVPNRHSVFWGGFNMIRATLELVQAAWLDESDHFTLVSDDTFWLKPPSEFSSACLEAPNRIDQWKIGPTHPKFKRYSGIFNFDGSAFSARYVAAEERQIHFDEIAKIHEDLLILREIGKADLDLRMGSQWWSLSRSAIDRVIAATENRAVLRSFRYSAIPDEMFFQTLAVGAEGAFDLSPMYADFSREPKPFVFRSEEEISSEAAVGKFFIRKVDPNSGFVRNKFI